MTYLDTHAVLWLHTGDIDRLPRRVTDAIDEDDVLVSPMVQLELQYLRGLGRVVVAPRELLSKLSEEVGLSICTRKFTEVVARAMSLTWTRNPFDRMTTAHASLTNSRLLTKDKTIRSHYKRAVWD